MTTIDIASLVADGHLDLDAAFDRADWSTQETVASYVACCYGDDGTDPGDVNVDIQTAEAYGITAWRWHESESGDCGDTLPTEAAAREAAQERADIQTEAGPGEDAACLRHRLLTESAGDPDPDGAWCVYWESACQEDEGVRERYETEDAATAACEIANDGLHAANPGGHLLCGFEVRELVDGEWVRSEEE